MVEVRDAAQKNGEAIAGLGFAFGGVGGGPTGLRLRFDGCDDHADGVIEFVQHFGFGGVARFGEFQIAIADVSVLCHLRADVIAEIAGEVEDQVADTVAERKRISPELLVTEGINPFVEVCGPIAIFLGQGRGDCYG